MLSTGDPEINKNGMESSEPEHIGYCSAAMPQSCGFAVFVVYCKVVTKKP